MNEKMSTEFATQKASEFDGGTFTINYLPDSPEGLEVETAESLPRHLPNTPLPEARRIKVERDKEPKKFRVGAGFAPKIGIRNIRQKADTLSIDIKPVTFPTFKAINTIDENQEALDASNPAATAGILLTTEPDGSHRFIIQHRSTNNFFYGDIPGASVAGYLDGHLDSQNRGRLKPVDTMLLKANLAKELDEELGIHIDDVDRIRITGVAADRVKVHDEFLLFGISKLTTNQISERVEQRAKEKRPNDEFDFEGSYFVIDGTPEAVFKLLTEVKCPLPPTHTAAFVAAGFNQMIDRDGLPKAQEWLRKLETAIKINYDDIDRIVRKYWMGNSDKALIKPENKPSRNLNGYDPAFPPTDQGLPDIESELRRTGLINESNQNKELVAEPANAWVFDIDGVITSPTEKRIVIQEITQEIIKRLERREPVALITGRAFPWLMNQVVNHLEESIEDKNLLDSLFVSAEFGGVTISYSKEGRKLDLDQRITIPVALKEGAGQIVESEFTDVAFVDTEKITHFSAEMEKGVPIEEFKRRQKELSEKLNDLVNQMGVSDHIGVHNDRIATNVKNKALNKHFATKKLIEWLKGKAISPQLFRVFGDSQSDLEMGLELTSNGKNVEFVYVGEEEIGEMPFKIVRTSSHVDEGTAEYLKSN